MNCKESKIWKKIDVFWKAFVKNRSEKHVCIFSGLIILNLTLLVKQIYKFEALQPAVVKKKERKRAEARPKKKPRIETEGQPEGAEVDDGRRKSSRISGKVRKQFRLLVLQC
jgi:hypothetical protein